MDVRLILTWMLLASPLLADGTGEASGPERSYWVHASLARVPQRGYWGKDFPWVKGPTEGEVQNAAKLLTGEYGANRLYLIYHSETSLPEAEAMLTAWRKHCPLEVELIPTLVLRSYDKEASQVFSLEDLSRLAAFCKRVVNSKRIAIYDIYAGRDQGAGLPLLDREFPGGMVRVGIQPDEEITAPFVTAVQDTWSGFCHGRTHQDWLKPGFGASVLRAWVDRRNHGSRPVTWNLVVVAWDYLPTPFGEYPGYDDEDKNMPLPAARNTLAMREILQRAKASTLAGFSCDLYILHVNSCSPAHDGMENSFYETLKRGEVYQGYYREPFQEVTSLFQSARTK